LTRRALVLAACTLLPVGCMPPPVPCARLGGAPMLEYQLFFGRGSAAEQDWAAFVADVVTTRLPDGFTVLDAEGQWMNPATGRISHEPTKVVVVAVPDGAASAAAIMAVKEAWLRRTRQHSVGTVVHPVCGAF
jgi:hypothetical protein